MTALVYLHGFRSSSRSIKATELARWVAGMPAHERPALHVPDLPDRPAAAVASVIAHVLQAGNPSGVTFIGSSLGGYYATHLAERFGARAVLVNPAVRPYEDLRPYAGAQVNLHSGASFEVTDAHFDELHAMKVERITNPARYFLMARTGDEVLDYREALAFYAGAFQFIHGGGDHAFADFSEQIPAILRFAST